MPEWIAKQDQIISCLQVAHVNPKVSDWLKVKVWRKIYHAGPNQIKTGVAKWISDKTDLITRRIIRDKGGGTR